MSFSDTALFLYHGSWTGTLLPAWEFVFDLIMRNDNHPYTATSAFQSWVPFVYIYVLNHENYIWILQNNNNKNDSNDHLK